MGKVKESLKRRFVMPGETGWYFLPAVSSVFFIGGSLGAGSTGLIILNGLMLLLALVSLVRPTVIAWAYLMVGSLGYLYEFLYSLDHSWHGSPTLGEWAFVTVLGVLPTASLWWHRPRPAPTRSLRALLDETTP